MSKDQIKLRDRFLKEYVTPRIFEVDPLSVDSIEGHNQVSGKGSPTTGPRSEAGNVVVHRGLHNPMLDVWYSVVMLTGYVVDWYCMSMDLEVTVTRMVRAQREADRREAGRTREGHMDAEMPPRRGARRGGRGGRGRGAGRVQPEVQPVAQATDPAAPVTHADLAAMEQRFRDLIMQMREQQQPAPPAPAPAPVPALVPAPAPAPAPVPVAP
ncbi:gag protease polyprotein [Cucumis melo var. makuwa]|uniref:Gag protease polyprotein n=1 Tax=Cucumis melo var. makuwa TaxID=1194695 RepID=A0A5A7T5I2_CUCMM|nr:gag protease polyprotein [Cucumis melo var. makuwa]